MGIERREEREGIERMVLAARGVMREMGSRPRVQEGVGLGEAYGPGRPVDLAGLPTPAGPGALSLSPTLLRRKEGEKKMDEQRIWTRGLFSRACKNVHGPRKIGEARLEDVIQTHLNLIQMGLN